MYELPPATPSAPRYGDGSAYAELKRRVEAAGLLGFQPRFYWYKTTTSFALLALSLAVLVFARRPMLVLLDAPILALVFGQTSNLLHESCHNIVCSTPRRNAR